MAVFLFCQVFKKSLSCEYSRMVEKFVKMWYKTFAYERQIEVCDGR